MINVKNVSPLGELEVPLLGRTIAAGETVKVTEEHAELLLRQPANFAKVSDGEQLVDELRTELASRGLPTTGKKAELEKRLEASDQERADAAAAAEAAALAAGEGTGDSK